MDWMTEKNPVFDLVISQASKLSQPFWRKAKTKDELGFEKNFCQFNFIERIYGLAGPPQQLEFVTVPPAPRDLSSSFPFFFLTKRSFTQRCTPLCAFNDVCHYEYCQSAHKTVCYIPFHFRKKDCSLHEGGILGKYRISFCTTPRDSVDHYFSLYERRFVSWNLNKSLKRAIQETLDAGIRISFSLLFLFCCLI